MSYVQHGPGEPAAKGFGDALNGAIRENPVAAGLIGMGALWMFFGGAKVPGFGSKLTGAARSAAGAVAQAGSSAAGGLSSAGSQVTEAARTVGGAISSGVQGAGSYVRDAMASGYGTVNSEVATDSAGQPINDVERVAQAAAHSGMEFAASLQKNLSETLDRQPLLLGAIGLAIGAGIASAFPSTQIENDFMGEAGTAAREKIHEFASDTAVGAATRGQQIVDDVKRAAEAHGLTPSATLDAMKGVGEKVKSVAGSATRSIKSGLSKEV